MIAVATTECNIYTRLWCVFEMFTALELGVPVGVANCQIVSTKWDCCRDALLEQCQERVNSKEARCGNPSLPMNEDEKAIRAAIDFVKVDQAVEKARLDALKKVDR